MIFFLELLDRGPVVSYVLWRSKVPVLRGRCGFLRNPLPLALMLVALVDLLTKRKGWKYGLLMLPSFDAHLKLCAVRLDLLVMDAWMCIYLSI